VNLNELRAAIERHAGNLDEAADQLTDDGLGLHPTHGFVAHLRAMSAQLRSDGANGRHPYAYNAIIDPPMHASAAVDDETAQRKLLGISRLLAQADVAVPSAGEAPLSMAALDAKLGASGLATEQRIRIKSTLMSVGRLVA
jgi:hypothetical protein